jgi:hypothetical protein
MSKDSWSPWAKVPPPPKVGDMFVDRSGLVHEVRAVVDHERKGKAGHSYHVVFRFKSPKGRGYRYEIVSCFALELGAYTFRRRRTPRAA